MSEELTPEQKYRYKIARLQDAIEDDLLTEQAIKTRPTTLDMNEHLRFVVREYQRRLVEMLGIDKILDRSRS